MAILRRFFGSGTDGSPDRIQFWRGIYWKTIGSGEFTSFDDFSMSFKGRPGSGDASMSIDLTDKDPFAQSGPCILKTYFGADPNATHQIKGNDLVINTSLQKQPISIHPYYRQDGTELNNIQIDGSFYTVWVGP
jgi:hypothetical protein